MAGRPFREFVLERAAIRHMHLFESRNKAFKDDAVLQENIIIRLERGGEQGPVTISTSTDAEIGIDVSTGPVVDFRLKEHLRDMPGPGTVPLLYPAHFSNAGNTWPIDGMKKPNAIERNSDTEKWLYPSGYYCVVRRFSSKEESRRIVASLVDPDAFNDATALGFENHLNVFHGSRRGLPQALAHGLTVFLNTSAVDEAFRRFSGHTQVNATDLRRMKYPGRDVLTELGRWAMQQETLTQRMIDERFGAAAA